ncbi:MAG TPA: MFS transporter [Bacilli bacterium]|nr:MFS transporter [Bacilli bacterium]
MSVLTSVRKTIGRYPKIMWVLAIAAFLNVGGLSFIWPLNSIYITQELGMTNTVAGIVLLLHSAGSTVGFLTGGYLFDRIGGRPVMLIGLLTSTALLTSIGLFDSWPLYVTVMTLFGVFASLVFPAINAYAAQVWPAGGRRAFNFVYVANNLGVAGGSATGGLVAQYSFHAAFLAAALTMLILALFITFFVRDRARSNTEQPTTAQGTEQASAGKEMAAAGAITSPPVPWLPIISLFIGFIVLWLVYVQWQTQIAVYMQSDIGIVLAKYSVLWTLNGLVIFFGQPLIALVVRWFKSLSSQLFVGTFLYLVSFSLILTTDAYWIFVVAMIVTTLGEMLLWPGIPAAVAQLSPPSRLGFLQGFIGMGATIGRMLGPLVGGLLYDHTSFHTLLLVMLGLLIIPTLSFIVYTAISRRHT